MENTDTSPQYCHDNYFENFESKNCSVDVRDPASSTFFLPLNVSLTQQNENRWVVSMQSGYSADQPLIRRGKQFFQLFPYFSVLVDISKISTSFAVVK
jgi:hypothetical protein